MQIPHLQRAGGTLAAVLLTATFVLANYTVTGKFQYEDREFDLNGFTGTITPRPIRFADVQIMANSTLLATGATREDGTFSISVPSSTSQLITAVCVTRSTATPDLLLDLRVAPNNYSLTGDTYSVTSLAKLADGSQTVEMAPTLAPSANDAGKSFNIWDVLIDAMQFVASPQANGSFPSQKLTVIWRSSHPDTGSFFVPADPPYLYVGSPSAYDDTIISHEFGHFIDHVFSHSDSPGGTHYLGDNRQDMRLSWGEGLATFLGSSARSFKGYDHPEIYVNTDGVRLSFSFEIETLAGVEVFPGSISGSTNEIAVTAALWDITDGPDTRDSTPGVDDDQLQRPFSEVWKDLTAYFPTVKKPGITIETFWNGWFDPRVNNGFLQDMQRTFSAVNGIDFLPDTQEPDDSPALARAVDVVRIPPLLHGPKVVINEIDLGIDDSAELYNAGDTEADISQWKLVATSVTDGVPTRATWVIPSFKIPAGGYVILSEGQSANTNYILYFNKNIINVPWANGLPGSCALLDSTGAPADFVRWGGSSEPVPDGTSFTGPDLASPPPGKNLGRDYAGTDTDASSDWSAQIPTFGDCNSSGLERQFTFYPSGDVDYAAFNALSGRNYLVETLNLSNGADTTIDVIASDGLSVLASNDDFGTWKSSRLQWTAPSSGKYYIRVKRYDGPTNFAQYGTYELRVLESASALSSPLPATLTVSRAGQGGKYQTISAALSAASNGDTVWILDSGTYTENLSILSSRSVTLKAAGGKNPVLDGSKSALLPALSISNAKSVRIEGITVTGGAQGIQVNGGDVTVVDSIFNRASAFDGTGDGIRVRGDASKVSIVNCTFVNNSRYGVGVESSGAVKVANSIFRNNAGGGVVSDSTATSVAVHNSLLSTEAYAGNNGNIAGDPLFVDAGNGNFRLSAGSPVIDKGDGADIPPFDADGIPRSLDGAGSGKALPDMGAYEYLAPGLLNSAAVFPQIAVGGDPSYRTTIVAVNQNTVSATANISLTKSDASSFPAGVLSGPENIWLAIPPYGTVSRDTTGTVEQISGYATLLSNLSIKGTALFKTVAGDNVLSEAGVGLPKPVTGFTVYVDNLNNAYSGYAVANFGTAPANLTLKLRDSDGNLKDVQLLALKAGQHQAEFAVERFPATARAGFEGSIEFVSDQLVSAVALRYDNPFHDVFSTIPVLAEEKANFLYFPQVADGNQYRTNFVLVNPSETAATAKVEFFSDDGSQLPLLIGGVSRTSYTVALNPRGVVRFYTDGTSGNLSVGWARVTASQPIGGSAIFQTISGDKIKSEAGVSSSLPSAHAVAYVESINNTSSGLALCNPNSGEVSVTLNLFNGSGQKVATTGFKLAPLGHIARFFSGVNQWFPTGFDQFQGTLEVIATDKVSAVALRYDNYLADVFATLPVIIP